MRYLYINRDTGEMGVASDLQFTPDNVDLIDTPEDEILTFDKLIALKED